MKINAETSTTTAGVSHGLVLGPSLINASAKFSKIAQYADYTVMHSMLAENGWCPLRKNKQSDTGTNQSYIFDRKKAI